MNVYGTLDLHSVVFVLLFCVTWRCFVFAYRIPHRLLTNSNTYIVYTFFQSYFHFFQRKILMCPNFSTFCVYVKIVDSSLKIAWGDTNLSYSNNFKAIYNFVPNYLCSYIFLFTYLIASPFLHLRLRKYSKW